MKGDVNIKRGSKVVLANGRCGEVVDTNHVGIPPTQYFSVKFRDGATGTYTTAELEVLPRTLAEFEYGSRYEVTIWMEGNVAVDINMLPDMPNITWGNEIVRIEFHDGETHLYPISRIRQIVTKRSK